jgi:putative ATP-dependent endonuclease of OLD family
VLLENSIQAPLNDHGLWLTDANGHEHALKILEAFVNGGLSFAGMVDDEGKHPTRWKKVKDHMGELLHQWNNGCLEQIVIPYFNDDELYSLIVDPQEELTGHRLRTLADRLTMEEKDFESLKHKAGDNFRQLIIEAACGFVPVGIDPSKEKTFRSHGKSWFKTVQGGRELGQKAFIMTRKSELRKTLAPFVKAVKSTLGMAPQ